MISLELIKRFQQISYFFNQQAYARVVALFSAPLSVEKVPVEIALMYAVALRRVGQQSKSKASFSAAIAVYPTSAELRNAFGNLLLEMDLAAEALEQFEHVVKLTPDSSDGYLNSARALSRLGEFDLALQHAKAAYKLKPADINVAITLAEALTKTDRMKEAEGLYDSLLLQQPDNIKLLNNYGNFNRRLGRIADAIALLERASVANHPTVLRNLAACYALNSQLTQAYECYQAAITAAPDDVIAYSEYAALLWQQGADQPFLHIEQRLNAVPEHHFLRTEYIKMLLKLAQPDRAGQYLLPLLQQFPTDSTVLTLATMVYRDQGELEKAEQSGRQALANATGPSVIAARSELGYTLLALHKGAEAQLLYQQLCVDEPLNQGWWTTLSSAMQLTGAEQRYAWLCNYALVNASILTGCDENSLLPADFNQQLMPLLHQLHCNIREPLGLSLRKGSQTFENLFERRESVLQQLQQAVIKQAQAFISNLQHDNAHPFLSRLSTELEFQGSWSVQLRNEGFHKSHFHPMGWLSGVYYVDIPTEVDRDGQGWLVFGRPDIPNIDYAGDYAVKPQPGMLLLFPSFMWHGTNPFKSTSNRLTVAFDIVPKLSADQ